MRRFTTSKDKAKRKALKSVKNDPDIIITRNDKGKGDVILEKNRNVINVNIQLSDITKFKKLDNDPFSKIIQIEDKLNRTLFLLIHIIKHLVLYLEYYKVHKPDVPIRRFLSAIKTFNYSSPIPSASSQIYNYQ